MLENGKLTGGLPELSRGLLNKPVL